MVFLLELLALDDRQISLLQVGDTLVKYLGDVGSAKTSVKAIMWGGLETLCHVIYYFEGGALCLLYFFKSSNSCSTASVGSSFSRSNVTNLLPIIAPAAFCWALSSV